MSRAGQGAFIALIILHLAAAGAGILAPHDPLRQHRDHPFAPPAWFDKAKPLFLLGTDGLGRDQFSRLLYGARISLLVGVSGAAISASLGLVLGLVAGFYSGWIDMMLMKTAELFLSLPWLYLLLAARAALPLDVSAPVLLAGFLGILAIAGWARPARLVRGIALSVRERQYVAAAVGFGATKWHVLTKHILPEVWPTLGEYTCLAAPQFVLAEVTLSFFGLGLGEPTPSWGNMLAGYAKLDVIARAWWLAAPAVALLATTCCYRALVLVTRSAPRPDIIKPSKFDRKVRNG